MAQPLLATLGLVAILGLAAPAFARGGEGDAPTSKPAGGGDPAEDAPTGTERAVFGGGCFWCLEAVFERLHGVESVVSGYAGGQVPNPTYQEVCTGLTGHAEVVQIEFDPSVISFDDLLDLFWHCHDPTSLNHQGPDFGTQYRSIILYTTEAQKAAAEASHERLVAAHAFNRPVVTQLVPLEKFYPAENYHQNYYSKHRQYAYCQANIVPKLRKLSEGIIQMNRKNSAKEAAQDSSKADR